METKTNEIRIRIRNLGEVCGFRWFSILNLLEFGLFSPANNIIFYIGIWYRQVSPWSIVWVARKSTTSISTSDCLFKILDGNLILAYTFTDEASWSTGINSSRSKDVQAVLHDNGNLVLRDGPNSSAAVLWQNFDHPLDTWLPGAKIKLGSQLLTSWNRSTLPSPGRYSLDFDHHSKSLITVWNGSKSYWSSGPWHDRLKNFEGFPDKLTNLSFNLNLDEPYITYSVYPYSTYRLVMDVSGQLNLQVWYEESQLWSVIWSQVDDRCAVYNICGSLRLHDDDWKMMILRIHAHSN